MPLLKKLFGGGSEQKKGLKTGEGYARAPMDCFAAICTADDKYEDDCVLLYIEATTGAIEGEHVFRFPKTFYIGSSLNW